MNIDLVVGQAVDWSAYASIPIAFEVRSVLDVVLRDGGLGGVELRERALTKFWTKHYDSPGYGPGYWPLRTDITRWRALIARDGQRLLGGAVVVHDAPEVTLLGGRRDLALVWDLRVAPESRGQGVGSALFRAAGAWARERGCRQLEVETQNINVPACRFYLRMGCRLAALNRFAYLQQPDETQLLWVEDLY